MSLGVEWMQVADGTEFPVSFSRTDLSLLAAVGQYGDLTEVARHAGVRHGTVDRRLERLDRAVGAPLTLRGRHTARLTSAGSRMLVAGRRFFRRIDHAARTQLLGHGAEAVVAPEILSLATTTPLLEEMVEEAATALGLLLSVRREEPHRVAGQLADYLADAAYTWSTGGAEAPRHALERPTRAQHVLDDPLWVILPEDHPLAARPVLSLAELRDEAWVSESGPGSEALVARIFHAAGLPAPARLQVADASVVRGILGRGDAVGLGSPTHPAVHASWLVRRSLVERPSRTASLLVDPSVVPPELAGRLAALIARGHLRRFAARQRDLLADPWWADWHTEQTRRHADPAAAGAGGRPGTRAGARAEAGLGAGPDALHGLVPATGPASASASAPVTGRQLDIEDLHLLRAVARHGSINRAAAVLSISQSALTRRIHRLEQALGARLLLRSPRGTSLTGPTRRFLRLLDGYEADLRAAAVSCRGAAGPALPRAGRPVGRGRPAAGAQLAPSAT
ncbi:LysR family transcriptional regulator [Streptomyces sp. NPDC048718]|uniref:LysR family transcriptional regulator n=1 Tax=Streptomyces sp. NPDC048718 TaxID=3365587 RepID=UPI003711DC26